MVFLHHNTNRRGTPVGGAFFLFLWGTWHDAWFFACFAALAKKPVTSWAKDAVEFVQKEGLTVGDKDTGSFRLKSFITRQEVAAVLKNEREKDETVSGPGFPNGCRGFFVSSGAV